MPGHSLSLYSYLGYAHTNPMELLNTNLEFKMIQYWGSRCSIQITNLPISVLSLQMCLNLNLICIYV